MTIKEVARDFKSEIMDGIAWVAIWKSGSQKKRWNAMAFWMEDGEKLNEEDTEILQDIVKADENAIFINEYYCAHMGDGTLEDIIKGIRFHYDNGYNLLRENSDYLTAIGEPDELEDPEGEQEEEQKEAEEAEDDTTAGKEETEKKTEEQKAEVRIKYETETKNIKGEAVFCAVVSEGRGKIVTISRGISTMKEVMKCVALLASGAVDTGMEGMDFYKKVELVGICAKEFANEFIENTLRRERKKKENG